MIGNWFVIALFTVGFLGYRSGNGLKANAPADLYLDNLNNAVSIQDTVPAKRKKESRRQRDTTIRANLGDSAYVGSAGMGSEKKKKVDRSSGSRRKKDTGIHANIGDSSYLGSGVRDRTRTDTSSNQKKKPQ